MEKTMENLSRFAEFKRQFGEYKLKEWYPNLQFEKYNYIADPAYYRIIDDLSDSTEDFSSQMRKIEQNSRGFVEVYDQRAMAELLSFSMEPLMNTFSPNELLIISPGGGGKRLWEAMPDTMRLIYPQIQVAVSRDPSDKKQMTITPQSYNSLTNSIERGRDTGLKSVLILDDTINTGATDKFIRDVSGGTDLSWMAASPIMLAPSFSRPKKDSVCGIEGFDFVFASEILTGANEKVPFNFLSSLTKPERNIDGDARVLNNLLSKAGTIDEQYEILRALKHVQECKTSYDRIGNRMYSMNVA